MKFGDVWTNDINYWMTVSSGKPPCKCCGAVGWGGSMISLLVKDGVPYAFSGYPKDMRTGDIKPYARYVGKMELITYARAPKKETPPTDHPLPVEE